MQYYTWYKLTSHYTTNAHTRLTALFPGLPRWAGTRKVKPIWILLEQETVSGSGISWAICKSAPRSRQITTPVPHHSVFYRPDALPAAQPTASKHWRHNLKNSKTKLGWFSCLLNTQETRWAYSTMPPSPHGAVKRETGQVRGRNWKMEKERNGRREKSMR